MEFIKKHLVLIIMIVLIGILIVYNNYKMGVNKEKAVKHEINDLYNSDDRIYRTKLSKKDQKMYDLILTNVLTRKKNTYIDFSEFGCNDYVDCGEAIQYANAAIHTDHPELMSYAGYRWIYKDNKFKLTIVYGYPFAFMDTIGLFRIKNKINEIHSATLDMSDKEKILYVYEWMAKNNEYDRQFTYASDNQSIYSVFIYHSAVCAAFAKASQIIFQNIGIKSYAVLGYSTGPHMWNIVEYNGKNYFFDSTVGVGYRNHSKSYFYKGLDQSFMNSYTMSYPDWYPEVESTNMFDI